VFRPCEIGFLAKRRRLPGGDFGFEQNEGHGVPGSSLFEDVHEQVPTTGGDRRFVASWPAAAIWARKRLLVGVALFEARLSSATRAVSWSEGTVGRCRLRIRTELNNPRRASSRRC
jgi:hypothetical protein